MQTKFDLNEWVYVPVVDIYGKFQCIKKLQILGIDIKNRSTRYHLSDLPENTYDEKEIFRTKEEAQKLARLKCEKYIDEIKETMQYI